MAVEKKSALGVAMVFVVLAYILNGALNFVAPFFGMVNPLVGLFADPTVVFVVGVTLTLYAVDYLMTVVKGKPLLK